MDLHTIQINVSLDQQKMPEHIDWTASNGGHGETPQHAKAVLLSLWDGQERAALRIDLWTKRMMVDEMNDFVFQTLATLADTYTRATRNQELGEEIKSFAKRFKEQADESLRQEEEK